MQGLQAGRLPADELATRFAERLAPLTDDEATTEAARCLFCFDAPCMAACPTSIDIPSFIRRIETGDRLGAARRILDVNVLGATCARVCATEELCEGACVLAATDTPIMIGRLQRYATDAVVDAGRNFGHDPGPDSGQNVAIIGGGPAGLACAAGLREQGHAVTIFERHDQLGGLATYGIIPLREPTAIAMWEAQQVLDMGVEARTGVTVGAAGADGVDVSAEELLADYDAVFIAVGSGARVVGISLDGADAPGVEDGLEFIEQVRTTNLSEVAVGSHVAVVGAGNTAMDACTIAARLGASTVTCVYRRTEAEMTGYPEEYEHCLKDGVRFAWLTQPVRVVTGGDGHVTVLECERMRLGEPDSSGRRRPEPTGERFLLDCDHVLIATGQQRESWLFDAFGVPTANGLPKLTDSFMTERRGVFAGGDASSSGMELSVVHAVAQGRDAALEIDTFLRSHAPVGAHTATSTASEGA